MECSSDGVRICPQCGCKIEDKEALRCPRCNKILILKCSEYNKCSFGK
ncbi:MAG: hypothetical protein ACOCRZ_06475 [Halothermotrichaceae bacterium]